jgi:hypothetical protein
MVCTLELGSETRKALKIKVSHRAFGKWDITAQAVPFLLFFSCGNDIKIMMFFSLKNRCQNGAF